MWPSGNHAGCTLPPLPPLILFSSCPQFNFLSSLSGTQSSLPEGGICIAGRPHRHTSRAQGSCLTWWALLVAQSLPSHQLWRPPSWHTPPSPSGLPPLLTPGGFLESRAPCPMGPLYQHSSHPAPEMPMISTQFLFGMFPSLLFVPFAEFNLRTHFLISLTLISVLCT